MFRYFICLVGILLAFPVIGLIILAFEVPITVSGAAYLLGSVLLVSGLILNPWQQKVSFAMSLIGLIILIGVASIRLVLGRDSAATSLKMIELPSGKKARLINYLIDEQDSILFGEAALHRIGGVSAREHERIVPALRDAYSDLRAGQRVFPSPVISTYLNLQKPATFDTIVIGPTNEQPAKAAVIFLHGYMGNVSIQCWRIGQAMQKLGMITVCPSTDWIGDWWTPQGETMVRATFRYLHERGIQRIILGGFSNGGAGTSRLAPKLASEAGLIGLFMIAGVSNPVEIKNTGLPVLVIQGTQDERMPVSAARQFTEELGDLATYVEIESDHFLIMKQPSPVQDAITQWLTSLAATK